MEPIHILSLVALCHYQVRLSLPPYSFVLVKIKREREGEGESLIVNGHEREPWEFDFVSLTEATLNW